MMILVVFGLLVAAVLLVALIDGGRDDMRQITQPVALPEMAGAS